jgi:hypothetical protein
VSRATQDTTRLRSTSCTGYHPLWPFFPKRSTSQISCHIAVLQPHICRNSMVWAVPRSLATTWGITFVFFSYGYLDVSVPCVSLPYGMTGLQMPGCPIRKSSDQRLFAPPRSLSQLITSFIASESQGIHHAPLLTFFSVHIITFLSLNIHKVCVGLIYLSALFLLLYFLLSIMSKIFSTLLFLRSLKDFCGE